VSNLIVVVKCVAERVVTIAYPKFLEEPSLILSLNVCSLSDSWAFNSRNTRNDGLAAGRCGATSRTAPITVL
jgi:hypothetical protein